MKGIDDRRWLWLAIALRVFLYAILIHYANVNGAVKNAWFEHSGDEAYYLDPADNLLKSGDYIAYPGVEESRASRMPGYGMTYLAFRMVASPDGARTLLVWLQVLLSGISVWLLARTALMVSGSERVAKCTFWLYGASLVVASWDPFLLTESLAASFLIFFLYAFARFLRDGSPLMLLASGASFTVVVFMRPFIVPIAGLCALILFWRARPDMLAAARNAIIFMIPFVVVDGAWVARNFRIFHRFVPLQGSLTPGYNGKTEHDMEAELAVFQFVRTVGGDSTWWAKDSMGAWFFKRSPFHERPYVVPANALTSEYTAQDLADARERFEEYGEGGVSTDLAARAEVAAKFHGFADSYRRLRPFQYRVLAPMRTLVYFLKQAGPVIPVKGFPQILHSPVELAVKLFSVLTYIVGLLLGLLGIARALYRNRSAMVLLIAAVTGSVFLLFPILLRATEFRFLVLAWPGLALFAAEIMDLGLARLQLRSDQGGSKVG
jgi:hypothetical protein